jgi:DNA-binding MarR family transcriptional regulator
MKSVQTKSLNTAHCKEMGRTCACFNLRKAARAITQLYDETLRPTGLRATQFTLLMATRVLGPVTVKKLAKGTVMDRTTLTRNLRLLERKRLIKIVPGADRREREVSLTLLGHETLLQALPLWEEAQAHVVKGLGEERMNSLLKNLSEVVSLARAF